MNHPRRQKSTIEDYVWLAIICLAILMLAFHVDAAEPPQALNLTELAAQVKHCVVNVSSTQVVSAGQDMPFRGGNPSMEEFFEHFFGQMPRAQREATALGSGFIISRDGLIVTNNHVVARAEEIKVRLADEKEYDATVVGTDPQTDLALIRVEPDENFPAPARLGNSDDLQVGATVMAVGNPFGLGHTVTAGIVSAKGRIIGAGPYDDFLQTDAAINPGNSGGPLFNMQGEVVGINTAIVARAQGIGFAIPVNLAVALMPQLKAGKVVRGWMGIMIQDVNPALAQALGLEEAEGVLIADLVPDGPAAKGGLQRGDVILEVDGREVEDAHALSSMVAGIAPETTVKVSVLRDGDSKTVPVSLGTLPTESEPVEDSEDESEQQWGMLVQELTPALAERLGYDPDEKGIIVAKVEPGSPAAKAGLRPGDLIKEANRREVQNLPEFAEAVRDPKSGENLLILVKRGENTFYSVLEPPA